MSKESALRMLETYKEFGWEEVSPFFNEFDNFYRFLKRNGVTISLDEVEDDQYNHLLFLYFEDDPVGTTEYLIINNLGDVEKKGDEYYLRLTEREDISLFFRETRNLNTRDLVNGVVGEDWYEPFEDTTQDVYEDVIMVLNPENLKDLKSIVLKLLDGKKIEDIDTDLMAEIATEQGHEDYLYVTSENIDDIFGDSDTMEYLLGNDIDEISRGLYSLHGDAYNSAYVDETWSKIMDELSTYFEPKLHYETKKLADGKTTTAEYLKINDIHNIIHDFLSNYKTSDYSDDHITYYSSFTDILVKMMDEVPGYDYLDIRVLDYPNYRLVNDNINDGFANYF